jgi:hypothetical protein
MPIINQEYSYSMPEMPIINQEYSHNYSWDTYL